MHMGLELHMSKEITEKQMLIGKKLYDAICGFDSSEQARDEYYRIMGTEFEGRLGPTTVREQILRVYSMLFCEDLGAGPGSIAGPDEVESTADRLYIGEASFDPDHWYRMKHHFPVIDEDNYDRFAALVISDLKVGPLHESVMNDGDMLLVGELNPLNLTEEERKNQKLRTAL